MTERREVSSQVKRKILAEHQSKYNQGLVTSAWPDYQFIVLFIKKQFTGLGNLKGASKEHQHLQNPLNSTNHQEQYCHNYPTSYNIKILYFSKQKILRLFLSITRRG